MDLSFNSSHKVFPLSKLLYYLLHSIFNQKNQSRKLFGLLEVGNVTLSIKFIAQEAWGHLGMACLRKAKMIAFFFSKILTTLQIVIELHINTELLRQNQILPLAWTGTSLTQLCRRQSRRLPGAQSGGFQSE